MIIYKLPKIWDNTEALKEVAAVDRFAPLERAAQGGPLSLGSRQVSRAVRH
jgi:hypothetical protein